MSSLITLDALTQRTPDGRVLFEKLTLVFGRARTGLVGRNGVGKTTLARLILGELEPSSGTLSVRGRVVAVRQAIEPPLGATVADVLGVSAELARLARIEAGAPRGDDLGAADWDLSTRARDALARCGLPDLPFDRAAATLSGGQATRVALARVLVAAPDFIVLDEPTNNLDDDGRAAVRELLDAWQGGALVISHDRALLRGMDRIVELSTLGVRIYGGGYDLYVERREAEREAADRTLDKAERGVARIERTVQLVRERKARRDAAGRRKRAKGDMPKLLLDARAEQAEKSGARGMRLAERQRADAHETLEQARAEVERARGMGFELPATGLAAGKMVLAFEHVSFAWPGAPALIKDLSFEVCGPERVALRGPNGAGKSTVLALAKGALEPDQGAVRRGVTIAMLDQQAATLRAEQTLLDNFLRINPKANANRAHEALARFLFRNQAALKLAGELSGGEKLRAALACALFADAPPQLLILDEPTNHLDLDSVTAIEAALNGYDGALLVVSHDADFLAEIGVERTIALG